jgi:hypothetical protein
LALRLYDSRASGYEQVEGLEPQADLLQPGAVVALDCPRSKLHGRWGVIVTFDQDEEPLDPEVVWVMFSKGPLWMVDERDLKQ